MEIPLDKRADVLPQELAEIYEALDFYPKSVGEMKSCLSTAHEDKQIITGLMRLCVDNLAVQISPGQFCRRGGD